MRETIIKVKLMGWRCDGLVFNPIGTNMHSLIEAIKKGENILMSVKKDDSHFNSLFPRDGLELNEHIERTNLLQKRTHETIMRRCRK